jgi:DNA-binding MarR family transcriptional regulator
MTKTAAILLRYLDEIGGAGSRFTADPAAARSLPVFVGRIYEPYRGRVFDRDYVLLVCTARNRSTPGQVEKHAEIARSALGPNVAFVFPALPAFDRKRFIQRRIPFIVPGRQTYLPMVMIDLRERSPATPAIGGQRQETLSAPAQALLLFHLQKKPDSEDWQLKQWADTLGYSRMTISRVYRELLSANLCRPSRKGRQVLMEFLLERRTLWEKAIPYLQSPVAGRCQVRITSHDDLQLYQAGMSALARFSMMVAGREETFAMSSPGYRAALEDGKLIRVPYAEDDTAVVERWRYAPGLLSSDGQVVDRLSLYLSMRHEPDERVQGALTELLENMSW